MNATLISPAMPSNAMATSAKPLWAAVGVLSVCVLAMGATLVHVNKRPELLVQASLPMSSAVAMNVPAALNAPVAMVVEDKNQEKAAPAPIKSVQSAPKIVAKSVPSTPVVQAGSAPKTAPATTQAPVVTAPAPTAPQPEVASGYPPVVVAQAPAASSMPPPAPVVVAQAPVKPACASCGTVEAVTPVAREGQGSGVGVIAGGVLGGVVGNQVGKGAGRAATTILGAIGGGWAGNAIEKKMKKDTSYNVRVRMDDGTIRTVEQSSAPMVGSKVTLDGNTMHPA